jgi:hypothetical protein
LGNGELASLAYGSFKELHKFAALILHPGGRFWSSGTCLKPSIQGSTKRGPSGSIVTLHLSRTGPSVSSTSPSVSCTSGLVQVHRSHPALSRGPILRGISSARDTLIDGKSVGQASPHRLHLTECWGLVESRPPDELATEKCWANSGIEANCAHSLGAPKTCKSRPKRG